MQLPTRVRMGTRGSLLAVTQAQQAAAQLMALQPGLQVETVIIKTTGDANTATSLSNMGGKGVFVKELEEALITGSIDFAVHSMKDIPGVLPQELAIVCVPQREDPRDVLVSHHGSLADLPHAARTGTGSPRRAAQLLALRPDLVILDVRGNLDTRLGKLAAGDYDALVLACAGMNRLSINNANCHILPVSTCVPAPGQGALAIEAHIANTAIVELLAPLNHRQSCDETTAERAFLVAMGGGCSIPLAATCTTHGSVIDLTAVAASRDGRRILRQTARGTAGDAAALGTDLAKSMLAQGAEALLKEQ